MTWLDPVEAQGEPFSCDSPSTESDSKKLSTILERTAFLNREGIKTPYLNMTALEIVKAAYYLVWLRTRAREHLEKLQELVPGIRITEHSDALLLASVRDSIEDVPIFDESQIPSFAAADTLAHSLRLHVSWDHGEGFWNGLEVETEKGSVVLGPSEAKKHLASYAKLIFSIKAQKISLLQWIRSLSRRQSLLYGLGLLVHSKKKGERKYFSPYDFFVLADRLSYLARYASRAVLSCCLWLPESASDDLKRTLREESEEFIRKEVLQASRQQLIIDDAGQWSLRTMIWLPGVIKVNNDQSPIEISDNLRNCISSSIENFCADYLGMKHLKVKVASNLFGISEMSALSKSVELSVLEQVGIENLCPSHPIHEKFYSKAGCAVAQADLPISHLPRHSQALATMLSELAQCASPLKAERELLLNLLTTLLSIREQVYKNHPAISEDLGKVYDLRLERLQSLPQEEYLAVMDLPLHSLNDLLQRPVLLNHSWQENEKINVISAIDIVYSMLRLASNNSYLNNKRVILLNDGEELDIHALAENGVIRKDLLLQAESEKLNWIPAKHAGSLPSAMESARLMDQAHRLFNSARFLNLVSSQHVQSKDLRLRAGYIQGESFVWMNHADLLRADQWDVEHYLRCVFSLHLYTNDGKERVICQTPFLDDMPPILQFQSLNHYLRWLFISNKEQT